MADQQFQQWFEDHLKRVKQLHVDLLKTATSRNNEHTATSASCKALEEAVNTTSRLILDYLEHEWDAILPKNIKDNDR